MKAVLLVILLSGIVGCKSGLSKSDREMLKFKVELARDSHETQFRIDSIQEETNYTIRFVSIHKTDEFNTRLKRHMKSFSDMYNEPYSIKKDRELTVQTYLDYCKAHNYDPMTYIDFLD